MPASRVIASTEEFRRQSHRFETVVSPFREKSFTLAHCQFLVPIICIVQFVVSPGWGIPHSVRNVAICWNIPRIPYAARYGVGTISRKSGFALGRCRELLRDYTRHSSHEEHDRVRSLRRRRGAKHRRRAKKRSVVPSGTGIRALFGLARESCFTSRGTIHEVPTRTNGITI